MSAVQFAAHAMAFPPALLTAFALALLFVPTAAAQNKPNPPSKANAPNPLSDPGLALDRVVAGAEAALRDKEFQLAESRYRAALLDAWMIAGEVHLAEGRLEPARDAFRHATASAVDATAAFQSLAMVQIRLGQADEAVALLTNLAARNRDDLQTRRLLAEALIAKGDVNEAVQTLEEAHAGSPDNPELAFVLATGYLHLKKLDRAEPLLARVVAARPLPETHLLLGRTLRDFGFYDRARAEIVKALEMDPRIRRGHYYLGTLAVMSEGVLRLDEAIREFREELRVATTDPLTNLRLGMALVEARRSAEALAPLQTATRIASAPAEALLYLGRCQLALGQPAAAVASLRRALERSQSSPGDAIQVRNIHYQLALALRRSGSEAEAAEHFDLAEKASASRASTEREQLSRYLSDAPARDSEPARMLPVESPLASLSQEQRAGLLRRVKTAIARACLNLGIMQAQAQRFGRAAEFFALAADVDPQFPQVQYSLGVAYFNAQEHVKAVAPLERALAGDPSNAGVKRMLAMALLNSDQYEKAASLLETDPQRDAEPSIQYAYGLALVRSNRAADAEAVFRRLLAAHGPTPELRVVIAQAHAQQGDYQSAIAELDEALRAKPDVAEANATLGLIYLRQGKLAEARTALRAELQSHPNDVKAAHTLATVLDLEGDQQAAVGILRSVLTARPEFADARYLLGKILLAGGAADEAAEQLEAAVRIAPEDANIHYQLAQAYRKQGRTELADQQFAVYQQLKEKRRSR